MRSRSALTCPLAALCLLLAACLCACGASTPAGGPSARLGRGGQAVAAAATSPRGAGDVAAMLREMTLPQKVGQLFVAAIPGTAAGQGGAELVRRYHLGGAIYFTQNVRSASQVAALSNGLQQAAMAQKPAIPLTIGTDQEGGTVSRLDGIVTSFPGQMAAGATRDPALVRAAERATGTELRALGINLDYAPVADVNVDPANPVIGTRSFGSDPRLVSRMTSAAISGLHSAGMAAAAKHFPGHGDTDVDSHVGLPVVQHDLQQWRRIDAPPFRAAILSGADMIMSAHIVVPALDRSGNPATLSGKVITGLLRDDLGFHGVVTTDSLEMAGVRQRYNNAQIAVHAILAGCDELLMPPDLATAYSGVLAAARSGQISSARLDQSVTRILTLKAHRGLLSSPYVDVAAARSRVATRANAAVARSIADRSVTIVKNSGHALPFARGTPVYVVGPDAPSLRTDLSASGARTVASSGAARAVVVTTADATGDPAQQRMVQRLLAARIPVIVVATGKPYDLGLFPGASAAVATYSDSAVSMAAAAGVLRGMIDPGGHLPVSIPGAAGRNAYAFGAGLRY